jgi:ankyrin repeat protein
MLKKDMTRFCNLFRESTLEGSRAAARKMRTIAERHITHDDQKFLLGHSLVELIHSDPEKLSWPNSPLLVVLQFVDPNVLSGDEDTPLQQGERRLTPLHHVAKMADHSDYSTHGKQLILAKQLIEHGANVNAISIPHGRSPLHNACYMGNVTNLDFIELLLEAGANPNAKDHSGVTPLMWTMGSAPGAATFLLNWPTADVNITTRSGASFLARVRNAVKFFAENPGRAQDQFLLQQWREIEEMLVVRGAHDIGVG